MNIATNSLSSTALRAGCRDGSFDGPTSGHALGYVQANMVILPKEFASEFREYCDQNPQPCPVLEILDPGIPEPKTIAPGADVRTDLPRYRVFRDGIAESEPTDITNLWSDDLVTFLLGCSFIAEDALLKAGLLLPHISETGSVPMYRTTKQCVPAGRFAGPMVVSMRPITLADAARAARPCNGFLGVWRHASGSANCSQTAARYYTRAGPHVCRGNHL